MSGVSRATSNDVSVGLDELHTAVAATRLKIHFKNIDIPGLAKTPPRATHGRHSRG
jgi:hypothetical protein